MHSMSSLAKALGCPAWAMGRALIAVSGPLLLAACQTFSPDGGVAPVAGVVGHEIGKEVAVIRTPDAAAASEATIRRLLRRPLDVDAALRRFVSRSDHLRRRARHPGRRYRAGELSARATRRIHRARRGAETRINPGRVSGF